MKYQDVHSNHEPEGPSLTPLEALTYSFGFGLLHGILPDEHTWPITFSYAIGGASGREGMKAGLYFSAAFTAQRMLIAELARLAIAPFLVSASINRIVYFVVGMAMSVAGLLVLRRNRYPHLHLDGHLHEMGGHPLTGGGGPAYPANIAAPPAKWTIVHGFIAGFGFGGFSLFVNTIAAPAMPNPWTGFLPGLAFGLGTMLMLIIIGGLFGAALHWMSSLTVEEIQRIGAKTGGRTLFFGGLLFGIAGVCALSNVQRYLPLDVGMILIGLFMLGVAVPAFAYSWKEVVAAKRKHPQSSSSSSQSPQ
jgi:sulfite exporter TauE/SafE